MNHFIIITILLLSFSLEILATSPKSQQDDHSTSSSDNSLQSYHSTASSFNNSPERKSSSPKQEKKEIAWQDKGIVERHDEIQWHDKQVAKDKHTIHQGSSGASSSRITPSIGEVSTLSAGHLSRSPPRTSPPRTSSPRDRISARREVISFSPSPPRERRTVSHDQQPSTSRSRHLRQSEHTDIDMLPHIYRHYVNLLRDSAELPSQGNSISRTRSRSPNAISSSNRQIQQQTESNSAHFGEDRTLRRQIPSHNNESNNTSSQSTTRTSGRHARHLR